ncbi:MAG: 5-oxoprolinase subunit PxpA [Oscillospiraceae bacterium]|nr:5-oxoprolinase subunit PxpA [Oscillospiraceae bacterium]
MYLVDLNADLGESFGAYTIGMDSEVLRYITSANVACGFHAGDPVVMEKTVALAKERDTRVGAHPGYPDLMGFGRRNLKIKPAEAKAYIKYQVGALLAFTNAAGVKMQHVKPHGAFYNMAAVDDALALAICEGVYEVDPSLILLGLAGSAHIRAAEKVGLRVASEVFADRAYMEDGTLVPRGTPGAMVHDRDLAIERTVRMVKEGVVETLSGKIIPIRADSICVHGDNPDAIGFTEKIRDAMIAEGVTVTCIENVLAAR